MNWKRALNIAGLVVGFGGIALTTIASMGSAPAWVGGAILAVTQLQKAIAAAKAEEPPQP